jgi:capsule polysaccharide export protein KpsE/RkpR
MMVLLGSINPLAIYYFLASTFFSSFLASTLAGAAAAGAATAGAATGAFGASVAKEDTANKPTNRLINDFMDNTSKLKKIKNKEIYQFRHLRFSPNYKIGNGCYRQVKTN